MVRCFKPAVDLIARKWYVFVTVCNEYGVGWVPLEPRGQQPEKVCKLLMFANTHKGFAYE